MIDAYSASSDRATALNGAFRILMLDDHETTLNGVVPALQQRYSNAEILTAKDLMTAKLLLAEYEIQLLVLDLSIPAERSLPAQRQVGLRFLEQFLKAGTGPGLAVLSTDVKPVLQFRSHVNAYERGFALLDKRDSLSHIVDAVGLVLRGSIYWPKRAGLDENFFPASRIELDAQWVNTLQLKFHQGLTDKAIAKKMQVSDRTVRNYWVRIQDSLGIPENPDKDPRIEAWKIVYELGLVD